MSLIFEKILKQAIEANCDFVQQDNESGGFVIYIISNGTGFGLDLSKKEMIEVNNYIRKVKKTKGLFTYLLDNKEYKISVRYRDDFGEQVFSLKIHS
jgi:aspartate ammonia-lyase